ncbi:SPOR domain-containing protein [Celeribacter indicus]|uniref:Sporulation related protein n=1 Tax=Celeribacter indicus TaxID=1208324 RepID=A0A0B5DWQ5_9RHOB|nr:SPOR domain-containing protein [Celeribacter indicus]AJE47868.1 sporulation related protein [Celeribacter indicus]SDW25453.1 Cell division protein DedD (protein involved in septation) [Celeribacter indicus]
MTKTGRQPGAMRRAALFLTTFLALGACADGGSVLGGLKTSSGGASGNATSTKLVERDVEAPDVFQVTDTGLWDGRPSLGGVWVAHARVKDPERVIIRNEENGKFVIGALFKREVTAPGPGVQVSSDAAEALGMLAGAPAKLNVTALRREEVRGRGEETVATIAAAESIEATPLDDPIADAAATLDALAAPAAPAAPAAAAPAPVPAPAAAPKPASALDRPYLQIGIFSVEANARRTVDMLGSQGIVATVKPGDSSGKAFWRVVVGPAASAAERATLLEKVKRAGFTDAYAVTH